MSPSDLLAIISGSAVGFILAVIGGGGSILATPALLYVVGVTDAHIAIGTSALAVSANAFANLIPHARRGNVKWQCAATFAAAGVIGAMLGSTLGKMADSRVLLPMFALLMFAVGGAMLQRRGDGGHAEVRLDARTAPRLIVSGAGVGMVSGFFGIGGGFLIVPGLIAATGMPMVQAIGSSLLSVGAFGATTAASYALDGLVDWRIALLFIAGGVAGGMLGARVSMRLARQKNALQRVFSIVVFVVAGYMLWRSLAAV